MKKILSILMTTAFVLAFGTAYAGMLSNGITDFSGRSYNPFVIVPASSPAPMEELQDGTPTAYNGATDFAGGTYDTFAIAQAHAAKSSFESVAAGGLRDKTLVGNGLTDFSGKARDTGEIDPR